jgi:hypothetical protein
MSMKTAHRVVYVATGERHIREAAASLESLWRHNRDIPVSMYVDRSSWEALQRSGFRLVRGDLLQIVDLAHPTYSWSDKPLALSQDDHERVLFLDTDTRICGSIVELFELLDAFDLAAAHAPIRLGPSQPEGVASQVPQAFPELNTGVIVFRRSRAVAQFLDRWWQLHQDILRSVDHGPANDQATFRVALYQSKLRFSVLTPEYNCRFVFPTYIYGPVRIIHGRWPDLERIERQINASSGPRVYVPGFGSLMSAPRPRNTARPPAANPKPPIFLGCGPTAAREYPY